MNKLLYVLMFFLLFSKSASAEMADDFEKVYSTVQNEYVGDVVLEDFVLKGLDALKDFDKNITLTDRRNYFKIGHNNYQTKTIKLKTIKKPKDRNSAKEWAEFCADVISQGIKVSDALQLKDFMLFDAVNKKSFQSLDKYSVYYPSLEDADEEVEIKKYFAARMIDGILYVKIKTFNRVSYEKLKNELENNPDAQGLILDLRGNKGGILSEAINVADLFLEKGNMIVSVETKDSDGPTVYTAQEEDSFQEKPIVILVDGQTASSAEMLTAALQEQDRAKILGTTTFGKGTVQNLKLLDEDRGFALTNAYFYSPDGNSTHENGLVPDECVAYENGVCAKQNREKEASDIEAAVELIKQYL